MVTLIKGLFGSIPRNNGLMQAKRYSVINENYAKTLGKSWLPVGESEIRKCSIKDIPFMTTVDGTIVCIPKTPEMGMIAAIGMTGSGKTLCAGYILDNVFWNWEDKIGVINDSQEETFVWSESCDNNQFKNKLKIVDQSPCPLPMIYVLPSSDKPQEKESFLIDKNYVCCSIPFEEVINNVEYYLPDLGNSLKYLLGKKEQLLDVRTEDELFEIIDAIDTGGSGLAETRYKLRVSFLNLINEGILNISNSSIPPYLVVKTTGDKKEVYNGNPLTAIMIAGCIPSFITSNLYTQRYKDAIFSYYINCLFQESLNGIMKGKRTWLYFDELTKVVHSDPRLSSPLTEKALNNIASRGRNNGISLIYATQRYNEIPRTIRSQTKYAVIFKHKQKDETKTICDDFFLDDKSRDNILGLKKFEAIAATTEYFICYKGNKRWETNGPLKGNIIPPMHKNRFLHRV